MKPDYFIVPIKLCPEFGNDERIILCSFGGRIVSVFDVMEWSVGAPPRPAAPLPPSRSNRVNYNDCHR